ncbi:MAG: PAS domain-containing protein [Actinobacteria bacterium]|nr:MAG: PAS domain-containing protein [Actinomycetota bacterium]
MARANQPLALILARNLAASITVPAFITDPEGIVIFYNEAAGELLGRRFEETGRLSREEWQAIGPVDEEGKPLETGAPLTTALKQNRPSHERFRICTDTRGVVMVETSALPLTGPDGFHGALVVFWPSKDA